MVGNEEYEGALLKPSIPAMLRRSKAQPVWVGVRWRSKGIRFRVEESWWGGILARLALPIPWWQRL